LTTYIYGMKDLSQSRADFDREEEIKCH